jgi:hypothetical protein
MMGNNQDQERRSKTIRDGPLATARVTKVKARATKRQRLCCCNPTLAKCGGEAQHFQSWGFGVLRDSRMFRVQQQGPKHLALGCSWCHWKGLEV